MRPCYEGTVPSPLFLERDSVRLACCDFGGRGPSVVLLHGLAGHAGEWTDTARWLTARCRVVAFDARGHGRSERTPIDVSRAAHVADTVFVIDALDLAPVILVGQSLGGLTALLVAAERPNLVEGLIVADASPAGDEEAGVLEIGEALGRWPVPFPSRDAAVEFFGGPSLRAQAWADGLEERGDGLWPRFDVAVMVRTLRETVGRSYWSEWDRIQCPTLVVRAGNGVVPLIDAQTMAHRSPQARLIEIPGAGHDLHLDCPAEWKQAVSLFLDSIGV
jgi:pimeloyl-ACP methyl ester carboxylesterase